MQECKIKFWHLLYFSHISIDWLQIFACLVQECESEIMFSVSTLSTLKYLQKILHFLHFKIRYFLSLYCLGLSQGPNQTTRISGVPLGTSAQFAPNQMIRRRSKRHTGWDAGSSAKFELKARQQLTVHILHLRGFLNKNLLNSVSAKKSVVKSVDKSVKKDSPKKINGKSCHFFTFPNHRNGRLGNTFWGQI